MVLIQLTLFPASHSKFIKHHHHQKNNSVAAPVPDQLQFVSQKFPASGAKLGDSGGYPQSRQLNKKVDEARNFQMELDFIKKRKPVPATSKLASLNPTLDTCEVMRVGGRLQHASIPFYAKHPIILDPSSQLSTMLIREVHERLEKASTELTPRLTTGVSRSKASRIHPVHHPRWLYLHSNNCNLNHKLQAANRILP